MCTSKLLTEFLLATSFLNTVPVETLRLFSPYTVRWQSWTSINFKELHRVLHLETKASPKNSFYRQPNCPKDNQEQKKCGLQVALLPTMEIWTFITFNNIYRAKQQQNPVCGGWEGKAEGQPGKHLVGADFT